MAGSIALAFWIDKKIHLVLIAFRIDMKMVVKRPTQNLTKIVCRVNQNIVLLAFRIQQLEQSLQNKTYNSLGATLLRITAPKPTPEYTAGAAAAAAGAAAGAAAEQQ